MRSWFWIALVFCGLVVAVVPIAAQSPEQPKQTEADNAPVAPETEAAPPAGPAAQKPPAAPVEKKRSEQAEPGRASPKPPARARSRAERLRKWRERREQVRAKYRARRERRERLRGPVATGLMVGSTAAYLGVAYRVGEIDRKLTRFQDRQRLQYVLYYGMLSNAGLVGAAYQNADREEALALERSTLTSSSPLLLMLFGLGGWMMASSFTLPDEAPTGFRAGPLRVGAMPFVDHQGRSGFAFQMQLSF